MSFLLLVGTAGGIAGDNSTLGSLEINLTWGQYTKNCFFARWLNNERVVDQTTRVSNLTVICELQSAFPSKNLPPLSATIRSLIVHHDTLALIISESPPFSS